MRCKQCNDELAITERYYCNHCHSWIIESAPAQEEKEVIKADEYKEEFEKEELTADLRERWDRAFFAAIPMLAANEHQSAVVTCARDVANETIRRHAELMASRDAAIAEVLG